MKFGNNDEFFDVIRKIIKILHGNSENSYAEQLYDALTISSVPGEIFGKIRLTLQNIPTEITLNLNIYDDINECLKAVDEILGVD